MGKYLYPMKEHTLWSPYCSNRADGLRSVRSVIIHWTATGANVGAEAVARYFAGPGHVSAHDVIGRDGEVWHCVPYSKAAWHAGHSRYDYNRDGDYLDWGEMGLNATSVGLEFCGTLGTGFTDRQIYSGARLIRRIDRRCPNFRLRDVTDHEKISLEGKVDVDRSFPAARLFWWVVHPYRPLPGGDIYAKLPEWAKQNCREIWG